MLEKKVHPILWVVFHQHNAMIQRQNKKWKKNLVARWIEFPLSKNQKNKQKKQNPQNYLVSFFFFSSIFLRNLTRSGEKNIKKKKKKNAG